MSNKKKSFLLHIDSLDILDDLDDQQSGMLFKAIKSYQRGEHIKLDGIVKIAFSPFKNQFIRDDTKYKETCERRAIAGSLGGKQKVANASKCKQEVANLADSVSKNNSDNDNKSDSEVITTYPENLNIEAWDKWIAFRKLAKFRKYKGDATMKKLAKMGSFSDQLKIVQNSIDSEYQGLFPLKNSAFSDHRKTAGNLSACEDFING